MATKEKAPAWFTLELLTWWAPPDSNRGPTGYEPAALTAELGAHEQQKPKPERAWVAVLLTQSGRRDSNPRPTAWKAETLPLSYSRLLPVGARGFEPPTPASQTLCAAGLRYAPRHFSKLVYTQGLRPSNLWTDQLDIRRRFQPRLHFTKPAGFVAVATIAITRDRGFKAPSSGAPQASRRSCPAHRRV